MNQFGGASDSDGCILYFFIQNLPIFFFQTFKCCEFCGLEIFIPEDVLKDIQIFFPEPFFMFFLRFNRKKNGFSGL